MLKKPIELTEKNSYFPPIHFNIHGVNFMVGVWTLVIDHQPYLMLVTDDDYDELRDDFKLYGFFRMAAFTPEAISRFGGIKEFLEYHFTQWNTTLRDRYHMGEDAIKVDDVERWFLNMGLLFGKKIDVAGNEIRFSTDVTDLEVEMAIKRWEGELLN